MLMIYVVFYIAIAMQRGRISSLARIIWKMRLQTGRYLIWGGLGVYSRSQQQR